MQSTEGVAFKCMYRLASGKFIVRQHGQVIGTYSCEQRAARALAAHLGVKVRDLKTRDKRQTTPHKAPAMVRGVYKARGGKFEVRSGGQYHGRFDTAGAASKNLAKIAGERPCASKKADRVELAAKRFRSAKATFRTWRPADLKDLIEVRRKHPLFCIAPGPLYLIAVVGKEQAWRAAIVRLARQLPASTRSNLSALSNRIGPDAADRDRGVRTAVALRLHRLLVVACQAMTKRSAKEQAYWVNHVNRNVAHHAGWLPFMQRMGILAKTTMQDKSRLVFGNPDMAYKILPFSERKHVRVLTKLSEMQQALLATRPLCTLDDWAAGCESFKTTAGERRERDSYSFLWTFRAAMIAERAAAGCKKLQYNDKNTTDDLAKAFPDQCEWVSYFCPGGPVPVGQFVSQLGYKDSIEYLTCDLCIFMPIAEHLSTVAGEHEPHVKRCRTAMDDALLRSHGQQAHPAVVAGQATLPKMINKSMAKSTKTS